MEKVDVVQAWPVGRSLRGRWHVIVAVPVIMTGLVVLFAFDPAGTDLFPSCLFHAVTGLHCPGCGTLRGLHQLLHGNLLAALDLNPLMVLSLPFLGYAFLSRFLDKTIGKHLPRVFLPAGWIWTLLGVIIVYWILRNIPWYPLSLLAP